eukprot:gene10195-13711_t
MAEAAGQPPVQGALRDPATFKYVGKATPRVDIPAKVRGEPIFSQDFTRPGMVYACAVLAPVFGGQADGFDDSATLAVKGVEQVVPIPGGAASRLWPRKSKPWPSRPPRRRARSASRLPTCR